jgi:hypothetical protein
VSVFARERAWGECLCVRVCGCTAAGMCLRACSITYQKCEACAPYCLRPPWLHHIFRHYLKNDMIFGKKLLDIKCVFWFSLNLLFETFGHSKKNSARYCHKCKSLHVKYLLYSGRILNETRMFSTDFQKVLKCQISSKSVSGSRVVSCGRTDGRPWRC